MKSALHETLLSILFLSSLVCVLGSVVIHDGHYEMSPLSVEEARQECRLNSEDWDLVTQSSEVDTIEETPYRAWVGLKEHPGDNWKWSDGSEYSLSWSVYLSMEGGKCAYLALPKTSSRYSLKREDCDTLKFFFYCNGTQSGSSFIILVTIAKTWKDAEQYCKAKYIDLAVLETSQQRELFPNDDLVYVWTGIHRTEPGGDWVGSSGTAAYENWAQGKPSGDGNCVGISTTDRKMANFDCASTWPSYCSISNLVLVKENKNWEEALEHCRAMDLADPNFSHDLISISDDLDKLTVWGGISGATTDEVWTGLRYLSHKWFWVDGTEVPYQDLPHCPDLGHYCGTLVRDNSTIDWKIRNCSEKRNFLCYKIQI